MFSQGHADPVAGLVNMTSEVLHGREAYLPCGMGITDALPVDN
ncbi:hypothetical protein RMHFA_04233 [Roseomonas mucosa]|nr:hypothetical protein RMHFA_04233 [Roseomonas mucosa]